MVKAGDVLEKRAAVASAVLENEAELKGMLWEVSDPDALHEVLDALKEWQAASHELAKRYGEGS